MNIFEKMLAITTELQTVAKNLTVGTGNNQYKAVSERDIIDAVKPLEDKYRVYSYPFDREVLESNLLETEKSYTDYKTKDITVTKSTTFMTRIKTIYRFVNVEKPEEYIDTITFAEGIDPQDKGSGKAMTYADKYALMKAYKISTGDDPDQNPSEPTNYTKKGNNPKPKQETPKQESKPKQETPKQETPKQEAPKRPLTPREELIAKLDRLKIDPNEYAKEKGLSPETTPERFKELLEELIIAEKEQKIKESVEG